MEETHGEENELNLRAQLLTQRKLERQANVFEIVKRQTEYRGYDDICNNKFKL